MTSYTLAENCALGGLPVVACALDQKCIQNNVTENYFHVTLISRLEAALGTALSRRRCSTNRHGHRHRTSTGPGTTTITHVGERSSQKIATLQPTTRLSTKR
eukprot:2945805-Pleurochrysis_carterae.AAC.3